MTGRNRSRSSIGTTWLDCVQLGSFTVGTDGSKLDWVNWLSAMVDQCRLGLIVESQIRQGATELKSAL